MKQLDNSIFQLKNNPYWALKVEAKSPTGVYYTVENNVKKETLEQKFGSIKNFFEDLNKKGLTEIRITDRKANGSVFKTMGTYELSFQNGNATAIQPETAQNAQPMGPTNYPAQVPGMNAGMFGHDQVYKMYDHGRLERELTEAKSDLKVLKVENEKLKEENLKHEILGTKKVENTEAQAKLMASAAPFMPFIQALLMGARGQQEVTPGLSAPTSQVKTAFMQIDDEMLIDLLPVVQGMQNEEFESKLKVLLQEFNLISA